MLSRIMVWFSATLSVLTAFAFVLIVGPITESKFLPVINIRMEGDAPNSPPYIKENRLYFHITGPKWRQCPLNSLTFAWFYDHSAEIADGRDEDSNHAYQPLVNRPAGATFRTHLISVEIPVSALTHKASILDASFYHQCHAYWPVYHHIGLEVRAIAPPPCKAFCGLEVGGQKEGP